MDDFDRETILEMTSNIKNCPAKKCTGCLGSIRVIENQVNYAIEKYEKLTKNEALFNKLLVENERLKKCIKSNIIYAGNICDDYLADKNREYLNG